MARHHEGLATVGAMPPPRPWGQIAGDRPDLFSSTRRTTSGVRARPFFQIGEAKYGKFMLELAAFFAQDPGSTAVKIALSSMLSTARANLSVGRRMTWGCTATARCG